MKKSDRTEINDTVRLIKADKKNLNLILDLEKFLDDDDDVSRVVAAFRALSEVFVFLLEKGDLEMDVDEKRLDEDQLKVNEWLKTRFELLWTKLRMFLQSDEDVLREFGVIAAFKFIKALKMSDEDGGRWNGQQSKRLRSLTSLLLSDSKDASKLIERFKEFLDFSDILYQLLNAVAKNVKKRNSTQHCFKMNLLTLLEAIRLDSEEQKMFCCNEEEEFDVRKPFSSASNSNLICIGALWSSSIKAS